MRGNTGFSLALNGSGVFTSKMIEISRGNAMVLTGNAFWKLLDQADLSALLKMCAFICCLVYLQSRIFILRFGFHSVFQSYIPNDFSYFISHTFGWLLACFPVLVPCNYKHFSLATTLARFIWGYPYSRNFKLLTRLCWVLLTLLVRNIVLNLDALSETISHCKQE